MWKRDNLRKNLLRVKQMADQNLGRSEKSEVLSEDLQSVEKRVETVKQICHVTSKKLAANMQLNDKDRRQKKTSENSLSASLQESSLSLGTDTVMGLLFQLCSECEAANGREQMQYELEVENNVIAPLLAILDEEIPTITKLRKNLSRLTLDMDSAKSRWTTALKQTQVHGANMAQAANKAEQIKQEYEKASMKVDSGKDMLAVELCNFVAREASHSQCLISYLEAKAQYYRKSLEAIDQILPKMHAIIKSNPNKPVYGVPLSEHLSVTERDIALPLEACVCTLLGMGIEEEGLFRIAGMASHVKKLTSSFDAGIVDMEEFQHDIHAIAGSLKQYLRELPEPLLTFELYPDFVRAASLHGEQRLIELYSVINRLPKENYDNLRYLIKFMSRVCEKSAVNKMTPSNLGIVLGPNLLWSANSAPNMSKAVDIVVAELLVSHADYFFPGHIDFYKTDRGSAPPSPNNSTHHKVSPKRSDSGSDTDGRNAKTAANIGVKTSDAAALQRSDSGSDSGSQSKTVTPPPIAKRPDVNRNRKALSEPLKKPDCAGDVRVMRSVSNSEVVASDNLEEIAEERDAVRDGEASGDSTPRARPRSKHSKVNSLDGEGDTKLDGPAKLEGGSVSPHVRPSDSPPLPPIMLQPPPSEITHSVLPSKEFHSDVYSTAFALQALGNGSYPAYMSKVRAMWDDQHYQSSSPNKTSTDECDVIELKSDGADVDFAATPTCPSPSPSPTPVSVASAQPPSVSTTTAPPAVNVSPSPPIHPNTTNSTVMSTSMLSDGVLHNRDSVQYVSPKVARRQSKKPAPRPPDRPHTMIVAEPAYHGHTFPRQSKLDDDHKSRGAPPGRPALPQVNDRPSSDGAVDGSPHKRSLSSDSALIVTNIDDMTASVTSIAENEETTRGGDKDRDVVEKKDNSEKNVTRQSSHRQQRPQPPPPPPPINRETESTSM